MTQETTVTAEKPGLKIISLVAENVKRLVAVEIKPDSNLVQITGKNGQGKTSVLDSIWWALAGAKHIQSAPIRKGANRALIRLDLGEIVVTRQFGRTKGGSETTSITVENGEGARYPSPQDVLDSLLGALSLDPLAFARLGANEPGRKKQLEILRSFVSDYDFDGSDKANKIDYDQRAKWNSMAKQEAAAAELITVAPGTPESRIDESALIEEMQRAGEHNTQIEGRKSRREAVEREAAKHRQDAADAREEIVRLKLEIEHLENKITDSEAKASALETKLAAASDLPVAIDVNVIRAKIEKARVLNANVDRLEQKQKHAQAAEEHETKSLELSERMKARDEAKRKAIAAAQMPIEGIGFGDGCVLLNDLPFDQASDAEQLRASVAIAMAMNPKLRVLRVRDGSLLDEDSMRILGEMCDANDFQCWVEVVDSSGKIGFVIENGALKTAEAVA